ncbi:MAG: PAS domain-containing protein, partial [Planctomycetota bacterium]
MALDEELDISLVEEFGPFRPLASRLAVPVGSAVALMAVLTLCLVAFYAVHKSRDRIEHETHMVALSIGYAAETLSSDDDLQRLVSSMAAEPGIEEITIIAGSPPRVLVSSQMRTIGKPFEGVDSLSAWDHARAHDMIRIPGSDASGDRSWNVARSMSLRMPRDAGPSQDAVVFVTMDGRSIRNEAAAWAIGIAGVLLALPGASLIVAWITLQRRVVRPIYAMADAVREGGEFAHIPVVSNDEIGVLATAINRAHRDAAVSSVELANSREEAERALREIAALRRALDEHLILSIADKSGKIIDANKGFCNIAGYTRDEILGEDHRILNSGYHPKSFWIDVWKTIASGQAWRGEVCNKAKDGSRYWVDSTIVPYLNARGEIERYVSIRFDISAQKKAEEALVAAQERAESISRSKSEFLANMSHEI